MNAKRKSRPRRANRSGRCYLHLLKIYNTTTFTIIKTKMKLRDRSLAPPRNFFTPGARPATASAAAPRSQATSPMLPLSLSARRSARTPHASRSLWVCRPDDSSYQVCMVGGAFTRHCVGSLTRISDSCRQALGQCTMTLGGVAMSYTRWIWTGAASRSPQSETSKPAKSC